MLRHIFAVASLALVAHAVNAAEAGRIIYVAGTAQVADRAATLNAPVQEGDMLVTGKDGFIYIQTADSGLFILRPSTKARIATYYIDKKNPENTRVKLELLSGVARSQSGQAVKLARQNFRFNTPVAAIGVRGTDFVVAADRDSTRVTVLSGGVTVSGFDGACRPEGAGPCEGATARELFANQKGMLLQYHRGQAAPQLVPETNNVTPDSIAPPRPDEPPKQGGSASNLPPQPSLDAQKTVHLQEQVAAGGQNNTGKTPTETPSTPIITVPPVTEVQPQPTGPTTPVVTPPVVTPPVVTPPVVTPPVVTPEVPERKIVWGRWQTLADQVATVNIVTELAKKGQLIEQGQDYVLLRTDGKPYVLPERGEIGFTLRGGEGTIRNTDPAIQPVMAKVENGTLQFNFDQRTYASAFDLVSPSDRFRMQSTGVVGSDGRFAGDAIWVKPNNMLVTGVLSNADGGSAAYLFGANLGEGRIVNGVTYWNRTATANK